MLAPEQKPVMRPFLAAAQSFRIRRADAAAVSRTLARIARQLGAADRRFRLHQSAGGAGGGGPLDRALARRQAVVADRRHAGRHQGHHRDRRHADRDGLAAVCRLALGEGRGVRARAARRRRRDHRQDGDDRIRGVAAARHAQSLEHGAHAGRFVERLGGLGRRRHRHRGARHASDQFDGSAGELLRRASASSRASTPSTAKAATIIRARAAPAFSPPRSKMSGRWPTRSSPASAAMPARPACKDRTSCRRQEAAALALLETAGWDSGDRRRQAQLDDCVARLKSAGIDIRTRHNDEDSRGAGDELPSATELSHRCNGWEGRWFFRSHARPRRQQDWAAITRERVDKYEDLTLADHRADLKERAAHPRRLCRTRRDLRRLHHAGGARRRAGGPGLRPAIRNSACRRRCSACRRCRCRCSKSTACRSACR